MRKILTQLSSDFEVAQANGSKFVVQTSNADGSMRSLKDILDDTRAAFSGMSQAEKEALQNDLTGTAKGLGIVLSKENGELKTQAELYEEVTQATQTMTDAGRVAEAEALAGKTAMAGLLSVVGASDEDYSKLSDAVYNADGAAAKMAAIMMDNLQGDFILFQSAAEGVKIAFMDKLNPHLRSFVKWITSKMPDVSKAMEKAADKVGEAISNMQKRIQKFTSSNAWKNADFFGKISIAWDEIIAQPFSNWWNSTGNAWFAKKAGEIGNGIGKGLTEGLLALLGFSPQEAIEDGISVGTSFAEGFAKGFDGKKVGEAIIEAIKNVVKDAGTILPGGKEASSTSGLSTALVGFASYKIAKAGYGMYKGASSLFGRGGKGGIGSMVSEALAVSTMTVSAGVVNVYGNMLNNAGKIATTAVGHITGGVATKAITSGAGRAVLSGGGQALLTGATAGSGEIVGTVLSNGSFVAGTGGAITQGLTTVGTFLGSGATTMGSAAAIGGASIGGVIAGIAGIVSGVTDFYQASQAEGKEAKDKYVQGGTKIGMVGAGAAAGALIGNLIPVPVIGAGTGALIGAGIGGIGALWQGSSLGKWFSDATDEGGTLYNLFHDIKAWASDTWNSIKQVASNIGDWISEKWSGIKETIYQTWSNFSNWFNDTVWTPIKDIGISVINVAVGMWKTAKETISKVWNTVSNWFADIVWNPIKDKAKEISKKVAEKWKGIKEGIQDAWNTVSGWFADTVWNPIQMKAGEIGDWISDKWQAVKNFISTVWGTVSGWFMETVWTPIQTAVEEVGNFVSTKWQEVKGLVSTVWGTVSTWFTDTVWEPLRIAADRVKENIRKAFEEAKTNLQNVWNGVDGWFEKNVWSPISERASKVWTDIKGMWENATDWVSDMGDKGSKATGLKTSDGRSAVVSDRPLKESISNFIDRRAQGGILTKPHVALVAEAGPEAIIPLSGTNKYRGIELWKEAGSQLGILKEEGVYTHTQGGIFGDISKSKKVNSLIYQQAVSNNKEADEKQTSSQISAPVDISNIHLGGINFTFNGNGNQDKESIMQVIRQQMPEIANEVAEEIAKVLQKKFANMKSSIA